MIVLFQPEMCNATICFIIALSMRSTIVYITSVGKTSHMIIHLLTSFCLCLTAQYPGGLPMVPKLWKSGWLRLNPPMIRLFVDFAEEFTEKESSTKDDLLHCSRRHYSRSLSTSWVSSCSSPSCVPRYFWWSYTPDCSSSELSDGYGMHNYCHQSFYHS